ncbi:MAG: hypothetical protein JXP73_10540 [Deltaproteobacteria bacterium]|jgi:hypothetical protein|nr:hypothetical protein [Deltaproteobacteria bacterium]
MKLKTLLVTLATTTILQFGCGGGSGGIPTCVGDFDACGGDLTGKWTLDGVCSETDISEEMFDLSEFPPECSNMVQSISMKVSGTVEYANGTETSDVTMSVTVKGIYTAACMTAIAETPITATQEMCEMIAAGFDPTEGMSMSCSLSGGGCACTMSMSEHAQETDTYTVSGGTLIYSSGENVQYCVSGDTLTVRDTSSDESAVRIEAHRS